MIVLVCSAVSVVAAGVAVYRASDAVRVARRVERSRSSR